MSEKCLVVIDMQNDFVDAALGTPEAKRIVPAVVRAMEDRSYARVFLTRDTHGTDYLSTYEGKLLPVEHCIRGTPGWQLNAAVAAAADRRHAETVDKPTFGSLALCSRLQKLAEGGGLGEVTFCGLCTDICVVSNALLLRACCPQLKINVLAGACAGTTPEKHLAALAVMESCQITVTE